MTDEYAISMLNVSLAQLCQNVGFQSGTNVSLSVLLDIYRRYMESMCNTLRHYCDHFGRTEPVLEDVEMMFGELRIPLRELSDYVGQVASVPFKHKVPNFPVQRPGKLKIPSSDSEELRSRPDYIPAYLPLMKPEPEPAATSTTTGSSSQSEGLNGEVDANKSDESAGKLNAARISMHRATISSGKQDLSQCSDLIGDFSDFDAIKAGLVKFVRVPTPPPRPVTPISIQFPAAVSTPHATTSPIPSVIIKQPQAPMIKVAEEKGSKKRQPTILDVRPQQVAKITMSTISSGMPHPKLKINFPNYKKRFMPIISQKKEKKLKILPPLEPGTSGQQRTDTPVIPKRRGRPPGSIGKPKKFVVATVAATTANISAMVAGITPMEKPLDLSSTVSESQSVVADVVASINMDTTPNTTGSSVEDLVTSVIEETRKTIKAKEKANEHFVDSFRSVISSDQPSSSSQKLDEPDQLLAGAGSIAPLIISRKDMSITKYDPDVEPKPSTSDMANNDVGSSPVDGSTESIGRPNEQKLKTILQRSRMVVTKDIIKRNLKERKERKEAEAKKIREVMDKTFTPIAKRQEELASAAIPPPVAQSTPIVASTPARPQTPSILPIPTPTPVPAFASSPTPAPSQTTGEPSPKPPRRPPGIPPTSIKISPGAKLKPEKPPPGRKTDLEKAKKVDFPPLFQPEHIKKTVVAAAVDNRKVAPLVISTKSKPPPEMANQTATTSAPQPEPVKKESTKLIIKLPHHPPSLASGGPDEKERKKKHHEKYKEKPRERHREKTQQSGILPLTVKKEKKDKEKMPEAKMEINSKPMDLPNDVAPSGTSSLKLLKLKINMRSKVITPTSSSSVGQEKEAKSKEKKPKSIESKPATVPQRSTLPNTQYDNSSRNMVLTPPPKSPSAHSKSPPQMESTTGLLGLGGYESPPPRTPSPGSSCPPSPIYETTEKPDERIASPPAKKQKVEPIIEPVAPPPAQPRNVIKIDKSQFASFALGLPPNQQPKGQQKKKDDTGWYCPVCNVPYDEGADMIGCDICDRWYHWTCVGMTQAPPENENWYCQQCRIRKMSSSSSKSSSSAINVNRRKQQKMSKKK